MMWRKETEGLGTARVPNATQSRTVCKKGDLEEMVLNWKPLLCLFLIPGVINLLRRKQKMITINTRIRYQNAIERFYGWLSTCCSNIPAEEKLTAYIEYLRGKGHSEKFIKSELATIKNVLREGLECDTNSNLPG